MTTETKCWTFDDGEVVDPQELRRYYPYKQAFLDRLNALEACADALRDCLPAADGWYTEARAERVVRRAAEALDALDALR